MIIEGIPAGDGECWVFLVDYLTFTLVTGEEPEESDDAGPKHDPNFRYKLYPGELCCGSRNVRGILSIEFKPLS